ncbi:hypothetical protein [Thaumasiovibrio subtropicus]|uniref:hypothetical protein n=1 Tax=Thaumasiovibrio subtropicus TaxID=1891207 RepID=UPI000B3628DA|nr:hypothetical protein [Thaumasiovibrio subtropicus]
MEIIITDRGKPLYKEGRALAEVIYKKMWQTDNFIDNNHIGIVTVQNDTVVGNMNICLRRNSLPCERFFSFEIDKSPTAEICGLAISDTLTSGQREKALIALTAAAHTFGFHNGIESYYTVQKKSLFHRLTRRLQYPFKMIQDAEIASSGIPNDKYWQGIEQPKLYRLNNLCQHSISASLTSLATLMGEGYMCHEQLAEEKIDAFFNEVA